VLETESVVSGFTHVGSMASPVPSS
jgi:hypothetical protein